MRLVIMGLLACALVGCGGSGEKQDRADAKAAASGFTPPTVTSRVDWGSRVERRFQELDRDQSGRLEKDEWPRVDARLAERDRNRDGVISGEEYSAPAMARFDRMDLNKDGTVTSEEQQTTRNGTVPVG